MRARRLSGIAILILAALGFSLRLAPLGRYVTPDEPAWVERSIRFADALSAREWSSTPSTGHPGVTTMWLGAAGVAAGRWLNPAESAVHLDWVRRLAWLAPENAEAFGHLAFFLPWGRGAVALTISLFSIVAYWPLKRLFERRVALLAVGLLSFEPFLVGHGGLLHTDGLLATFSALSVLCLLVAARDGERGPAWALASGVSGGLALLTKSLAGYLVVFAAIVLGSAWLLGRIRLKQAAARAVVWVVAAATIYVALYPAIWGDPLGTLQDLLAAPTYQSTTALMPTFFAGRMALRHGPQFYLVALPFRLSPIVLIGSLLSVWTLARRKEVRTDLAWLGAFCIGYVLLLALNMKRYQRYLLPTFGPLTVMAALALSDWWRSNRWDRLVSPSSLILVQFLLMLPFAACPLTGFNLLLGGPWTGSRVLSADWGEGMGSAARWLNQRSEAEQLTVAVSSVPPFASLFDGRTVSMDKTTMADYLVRDAVQNSALSPEQPVAHTATVGLMDHAVVLTNTGPIEQAHYLANHVAPDDLIVVDFETPLLRRYEGPGAIHSMIGFPDEPAVSEWLGQWMSSGALPGTASIWLVSSPEGSPVTAAHVGRQLDRMATRTGSTTVAGVTVTKYARRPSPAGASPSAFRADFGGQLILVDGTIPDRVASSDKMHIVLRWQALSQLSHDHRAVVALRDDEGHTWSSTEMLVLNSVYFPASAWQPLEWSDARYDLDLPSTIPPGAYALEVSLFRGDTRARLGATGPDGGFRGTRVPVGQVEIDRPVEAPDASTLDVPLRLDRSFGPLKLVGAQPPPGSVLSGDYLSFALFWETDEAPAIDYDIRLRWADAEGQIGKETIQPLSPYPTSNWRTGDRFESRHRIHVSPDLPAGSYRLMLGLLGLKDGLVDSDEISLAAIEVLPRERSFALPEGVPRRLDLTFGKRIHLWSYEIEKPEARPGQTLPLTLYWSADASAEAADRSFTLFVHLVGPDGATYGQVDRIPGDGKAPTTSWAAGQVIVDEVELPVQDNAPPGHYQIALGFYDAYYGDRLPVVGSSDGRLRDKEAILPVNITVSGGDE